MERKTNKTDNSPQAGTGGRQEPIEVTRAVRGKESVLLLLPLCSLVYL